MTIKDIENDLFSLQKNMINVFREVEGVEDKKLYCSVCDQQVPEEYWIAEQSMCVSCYNNMIHEQETKWGEERL